MYLVSTSAMSASLPSRHGVPVAMFTGGPVMTAVGSDATMSTFHGDIDTERIDQMTDPDVWNLLNVETSSAPQWTSPGNQAPNGLRPTGALFCI